MCYNFKKKEQDKNKMILKCTLNIVNIFTKRVVLFVSELNLHRCSHLLQWHSSSPGQVRVHARLEIKSNLQPPRAVRGRSPQSVREQELRRVESQPCLTWQCKSALAWLWCQFPADWRREPNNGSIETAGPSTKWPHKKAVHWESHSRHMIDQ